MPNPDAVIKWFDENSVSYVKRPEQGKMKNVAFIRDPDGYWIEILGPVREGTITAAQMRQRRDPHRQMTANASTRASYGLIGLARCRASYPKGMTQRVLSIVCCMV